MLLEELHDYYGSWSNLVRELKLGLTAHQRWRNIGYIPYRTQLLIEKRSNGRFMADEAHGAPINKNRNQN